MHSLKISLITVCFNAGPTIRRCIESVTSQDYFNIEYIIIDGASTDDTVSIAEEYRQRIAVLVSEPDNGLYDAMNKGIALATGDVIGILNADDFFADSTIISTIAGAFSQSEADIVYGNLNFIDPSGHVVRRWRSGAYKQGMFNWGWMPPHPTFYAKSKLFKQYGDYSVQYGSAGDYELMLRFMHTHNLKTFFLDTIILFMQTGGISNKRFSSRVKAFGNDFRAMCKHGVLLPVVAIVLKPVRKVFQYL